MDIQELATILDTAAAEAKPVEQLSHQHQFTEAQAYEIQAASIARRYTRGEQLIGLKMGFTSIAKMEQMGVHDMIWGRLTDAMLIEAGGSLPMDCFIHPRAEPEICFRTSQKIDRELSWEEAKGCVDGIAGAIEIIDSRYQNFKFSLEDVIADNCSSAGLVIGGWHPVSTPLQNLAIQLIIDGKVAQQGSSNDILGDPWKSFLAATRLAATYGQVIPAGSYIMAGAATSAVYVKKGQRIKASLEQLGEVDFEVV